MNTIDDDIKTVKVVAGQSSWRNLTIGQIYDYSLTSKYSGSNNENNILQSHMVKNSEWGAVAYLAHSKYGLHGGKVLDNSDTITGGNGILLNIYSTCVFQSTTHNANGVFDLNGGAKEYVASYINNGHENLSLYGDKDKTGNLLTNKMSKDESTKFKTSYASTASEGKPARVKDYNYNKRVKGDAIGEVSNSPSGTNAWFVSYSLYPSSNMIFFIRGGSCRDNINLGTFYFNQR